MADAKEVKLRKLVAFVGQMGGGKSYLAQQMAAQNLTNGQTVFVYNASTRPEDWSICEPIEIMGFKKTEEMIFRKFGDKSEEFKIYHRYPEIEYYKNEQGEIKPLNTTCADWYRKGVKVERLKTYEEENNFIEKVFDYFGETTFIIDDAKPIFQYGIKSEFATLFSKLRHAGGKNACTDRESGVSWQGVDVFVVFHGLEQINRFFWDYITHLKIFRTEVLPDFKAIPEMHPRAAQAITHAFKELQKMPRFSHFSIDKALLIETDGREGLTYYKHKASK